MLPRVRCRRPAQQAQDLGSQQTILCATLHAHASSCMPPPERGSDRVQGNGVQLHWAVLCQKVTPWVEWLSNLLKTITAASSRAEVNGQVMLKSFIFQAALLLVCACAKGQNHISC